MSFSNSTSTISGGGSGWVNPLPQGLPVHPNPPTAIPPNGYQWEWVDGSGWQLTPTYDGGTAIYPVGGVRQPPVIAPDLSATASTFFQNNKPLVYLGLAAGALWLFGKK